MTYRVILNINDLSNYVEFETKEDAEKFSLEHPKSIIFYNRPPTVEEIETWENESMFLGW